MKRVLLVFVLVSIFMCSFAVANAEVVEYAQDFETTPTGGVPPEFNRVFTVGTFVVGHVIESSPTNKIYEHLCIADDSTPAGLIDFVPITLTDPVFYINMQISPDFNPVAPDGSTSIYFMSGDGHALTVIFRGSDSMMYVSVGADGDFVAVSPFAFDTIYELKIEVDLTTHTYSVFLDSVAVLGAQNIGMETIPTTDTALAFMTNANAGGNGTRMLVDNILVVSEGDPPPNPRTGDNSFDIMPLLIAVVLLAGGIIFKRFTYRA